MTQRLGLAPLEQEGLPPEVAEIVRAWPYKLHRTLAHSPATLRAWMGFAEHILRENTLPVRDREIAILRVGWNCRCDYEWSLHARLARSLGFTDADLVAIRRGAGSPHWQPHEAALVAAVDELNRAATIRPGTWRALASHYSEQQLVDLVFVTGQFTLVSMALNAFRIELEPGVDGLPPAEPGATWATPAHAEGEDDGP
jgi:alkylhydroperoxidase family enzyme